VLEGSYKDKSGASQSLIWHIGTTPNYRVAQFPHNPTAPLTNLKITIRLPAFFEGYRPLSPASFYRLMSEKDTTALAADNIIRAIDIQQR
jgi:hypothetical protein